MKKILFVTAFLILGAVSVSAQSVSGAIAKGSVTKGTTARGYVILRIPKGLHVNSYKPESKNLIPTRLTLRGNGVTTFGITYPPGKRKKFGFSSKPLSVYEDRVYMGFRVRVPKNYRGKSVRVRATVRYQACTDEVCYAPTSKSVWLTARVR